ncbi:MAG: URC4/urg3 family protein [Methylotenera sp.]|nr:URC4/urg3 family protein [Oligoflexia bacterium]
MSNANLSSDLRYLLSPRAVREKSKLLFDLTVAGKTHFTYHPEKLKEVADLVVQTTLGNYPSLEIPFHSRWGHFQVGSVDRLSKLTSALASFTPEEKVKSKLDLAVVSVLLDAGAGADWKYTESAPDSGKSFNRSEGLAVASFHMFLAGSFSSDNSRPYQVDAKGLQDLTVEMLAEGFQVSATNPLIGLGGRVKLLQTLGKAMADDPVHFGGATKEADDPESAARPGNLLNYYLTVARDTKDGKLPSHELLLGVLLGLGPIWPGRLTFEGVSLGDVWNHRLLGETNTVAGMVPFHKLSQWLTYSLIEPLQEFGLEISELTGPSGLTGLAEYRNGGLLIDSGLIELKDKALLTEKHHPSSELVIEWRALTVTLLEHLAREVRIALKKTDEELPLARVLEGGTWWAGRRLAMKLRPSGNPPLQIDSDGTVF